MTHLKATSEPVLSQGPCNPRGRKGGQPSLQSVTTNRMKIDRDIPRRQFMGDLLKAAALVAVAPAASLSGEAPRVAAPAAGQGLFLWYREPASRWLEALPIGNGRVGAMVFGGVGEEKLALNEVTFWSGAASSQHENPEGKAAFDHIRELFKSGKCAEAQPLIPKVLGRELNYGTSLPAGELLLAQSGTAGEVVDYRRELNLDQAIASTTFTANGVRFRRDAIASHPAGLLLVRLSAERPGVITFSLRYQAQGFPWTAKA